MERNQKNHAFLIFTLVFFFCIAISGVFYVVPTIAQEQNAQEQVSPDQDAVESETAQKTNEQDTLAEIQQQLDAKKKKISDLKNQISKYELNIRTRQQEAASLANQISILNDQIQKNESEIELAQNEIDSANIEIRETQTLISQTEDSIEDQKHRLAEFINLLFRMERKEPVEVFLEYSSLSEYFIQQGVAERLQAKVKDVKIALDDKKTLLQKKHNSLQDKKLELVQLRQKLSDRNDLLDRNRSVRTQILAETKNSETKFRVALQDLKGEQNEINADIQNLEESIRKQVKSGGLAKLKELGTSDFMWPVPNNGITAYFHDQDYPFRYIFEHPAIDIRAAQGTPIRAPAPGFVARTRDGGKRGYSYLMLVHNNGISTVYGHVSAFNVVEDQFVNQGDIVAFSGGRPGTHGAGPLTTGPHLHFEVRVNGIPDDPLQYLP